MLPHNIDLPHLQEDGGRRHGQAQPGGRPQAEQRHQSNNGEGAVALGRRRRIIASHRVRAEQVIQAQSVTMTPVHDL